MSLGAKRGGRIWQSLGSVKADFSLSGKNIFVGPNSLEARFLRDADYSNASWQQIVLHIRGPTDPQILENLRAQHR